MTESLISILVLILMVCLDCALNSVYSAHICVQCAETAKPTNDLWTRA